MEETLEVKTSVREDGKTELTVELTAEEVKKHIDAFFKEIGKNRIPGFRPGKAPRKVLERNFGGHEAVYGQITSDMVNEVSPVAVDSQDIILISDPEFDELGTVADGEGFTFTFNAMIKPSLELSSTDPVSIEMPPEDATEADIDAQLGALQEYYYSFETVEDRAPEQGDYVTLEMASEADGAKVDALSYESRLVEFGAGMLPEAISEQLDGMKTGDTKEFDFEAGADEGELADLEGKTVHTKITVKEIRAKNVPELDDSFAEQVGFESMQQLRDELKVQIAEQKAAQLPELKERRCIGTLAERLVDEVPEEYVNECREDVLREFFTNLNDQNLTFDQFLTQRGISADDFQEDLKLEAQESAAQGLALDALFRALDMEITDEDIDKEFAVVDNPAATRKQWEESGRMSMLREAIARQKAAEWLIDTAVVTVVEDAE